MRRSLLMCLLLVGVYIATTGANLPSAPAGGEDGGGISGDTLTISTDSANVVLADTIGPAPVACRRVLLTAQWSGDSALVYVDTSVDGQNWFNVPALSYTTAAGLGMDDSVTIAYTRMYEATPDSATGIVTPLLSQWARMRLVKTLGGEGDSTSQVYGVWGAIRCAQ